MKIKKPNIKKSRGILRDSAPYCVAILFYLLVKHLYVLGNVITAIVSVILPLILGLILAYVIDPPVRSLERRMKAKGRKHARGKAITIVVLIIVFSLLLLAAAVIPQFTTSIIKFSNDTGAYHQSLQNSVDSIAGHHVNMDSTFQLTDKMMEKLNDSVHENIVKKSASTGKHLGAFAVDFVLAVYFLLYKKKIVGGGKRLFQDLMSETMYEKFSAFLKRCDGIFIKYLICEVLDALIVGAANAVFMLIFRMEYVPLVSAVVGVTNLIPTFGPLIGAAAGVFILMMVNPMHAVLFLLFTGLLQGLDGYVIKPKLYGNSLGIPGIWVLIAVILGGRIFGMWGMLLAIPFAAILDIVIKEGLMPLIRKRKQENSGNKLME
ncbi:AI-2E family transporter [Baileyella intestinalis]|nr:AI-2E family transporter [Baileyella intestinalis]